MALCFNSSLYECQSHFVLSECQVQMPGSAQVALALTTCRKRGDTRYEKLNSAIK